MKGEAGGDPRLAAIYAKLGTRCRTLARQEPDSTKENGP